LALGLAFSAFAQTLKLPPHEKVVLKKWIDAAADGKARRA